MGKKVLFSGSVFLVCLLIMIVCGGKPQVVLPPPKEIVMPPMPQQVMPVAPQKPITPPSQSDDPELADVQVKIPKSMRVFNRTGIQCVWASIQTLGNFHNVKGTQGLTDQYKGKAGSGNVLRALPPRNVKFKQITNGNLAFLKEWVQEKKMGVTFGITNTHMMTMVHYEEGKFIKYIDNSDSKLRVQTMQWSRFRSLFDGWAIVIFPDDYQEHGEQQNTVSYTVPR